MNLKQAKGLARALEQAEQALAAAPGDAVGHFYPPPTAELLEDDRDLEVLLVTEPHTGLLFWINPDGDLLDSCSRTVDVAAGAQGTLVLRPKRVQS